MARKILLADDSVTAQNMGRRILADAGYDVITVNNGSAALKKATEQKPDLIVLDVYMPGYGGLEVCQRLREAAGTARIPVLLTVGKLEPFKPEEARRVGADAFVIKPFEASELLAALAKLEDKIVPEGAPKKSGKSFRMDGAGGIAHARDEEFGDAETGWKNRLSIPPPTKKHESADSENGKAAEPAAGSQNSDAAAKEKATEQEAKKSAGSAPEGLPADIKPEEVAAIAAAAAAISANAGGGTEAASSAQALAEPANSKEPATEESAKAADVPAPAVPQESKPAEEVAPTPAATARENETSRTPDTNQPPEPGEAEVAAVLSKLVPAETNEQKPEEIPVLAGALAAAAPVVIGPHWVAQEIPVPELEATSLLMHEMEKMHAAMAAAEGRNGSTFLPPAERPVDAKSEASVATPAPVAVTEVEPIITRTSEADASAPEAATTVSNESSSAHLAEVGNRGATAGDAPKTEPEPVVSETSQTKEFAAAAPLAAENSAYAAAAAAGSDATSPKANPPADEEERQRASQLAAAWENWQNVRDSILGSPIAEQISEVAAETLKKTEQVQQTTPKAGSASASSEAPATGNPTAIANIVDSVLAELKPKLMEEIAKSLGKDKK